MSKIEDQTAVLKFGGNCLKNRESIEQIVDIIKSKLDHNILPVVVVSAMGRKGAPYATDTLMGLIPEKLASSHDSDLLLSCGETIASAHLSMKLQDHNIKSQAINVWELGLKTDSNPGNAHIKEVSVSTLLSLLDKGIIPVIPGFQGINKDNKITTLGRGGSDTTAAVIAAVIDVDHIEIFTDVKGVMTADPKIVPTASLLKQLAYDEAVEFAAYGAKVIHPRAAEIARKYNIPIIIKDLEQKYHTKIHSIKNDNPITGIALKENIAHFIIKSNSNENLQNNLNIFDYLAEASISIDFIAVSNLTIAFIVDLKYEKEVISILTERNYLFDVSQEYTVVSILGAGMTGIPGIMARISNVLIDNKINIYQITDSHSSISCLVKSVDSNRAVCILHTEFNL